jgi:hypothetical protein
MLFKCCIQEFDFKLSVTNQKMKILGRCHKRWHEETIPGHLVFDDDDNGDDSYEEEVVTCTVMHSGPERDMKKFITSISVCVLVVNRDWL